MGFNYTFSAISGAGAYTVATTVTNDVPPMHGSIVLGYPGTVIMQDKATAPLPATVLLLGPGLVGLAAAKRRLKRSTKRHQRQE